ncbi:MAG: hypothetical protein FWE05_05835 [Defluviitaleaceae bacterium]|nr:hypothetical protein [Defluviitaleaceae bacterium]
MPRWITDLSYKIENKAVEAQLIYKLASRYYHDVIERESVLANITEKDHILCIGGGICPFSAILFHQMTGAKVTVIDNNEKCIPKARQIINRLGIKESVKVYHHDGKSEHIMFADYSVVHLALQVTPIEQVFYAIERQVVSGTRLLIRRPKKLLNKLYCAFANGLLSHCAYTSHKSCNIGSTALYIKKATQVSA